MFTLLLLWYYLDNSKVQKLILSLLYASFEFIYYFNILNLGEDDYTNRFNNDLCELFPSGELQLTFFSLILATFNPGISKNVFYGKINETDLVVLKILTSAENENVIFCDEERNNLFSSSDVEPKLLQVLDDTYPIAKLLGSCQNIILEDYKGDSLINYYAYSWEERAYLAIQLLQLAKVFTLRHSNYSFYLTDLSPDNLVVDDYGKISLIDLDNVIVKNRNAKDLNNKVHVSTVFDDYYFSFSHDDICKHQISDHNYLAVCQYILIHSELMEGGLLHDTPKLLIQKYPQLPDLLQECAKPKKSPNRIVSGDKLEALLKNIVKNFKWDLTSA